MSKKARDYHSWRLEKLTDPEIAEGYPNSALEDSPQMFLKALLNVTQARQVAVIANKAGVKRETIYRAFSKTGNPTLDTLNSVLQALGLQIKVAAKSTASPIFNRSVPRPASRSYAARKKKAVFVDQMFLRQSRQESH